MPRQSLLAILAILLFLGVAAAGCLGGSGDDGNGDGDGNDGNGNGNGDGNGGGGSGGNGGSSGGEPGRIEGTVTGEDGPVDGARVSLSRVFESTETDAQGNFAFEDIPPGNYRVSISKQYYRATSQDVSLGEGQTRTVNAQLELQMIPGTDVPVKYGKMEPYVAELDILLASVGFSEIGGIEIPLIGGNTVTFTNETMNNTFPGFWDLEPVDGYVFARFDVVLVRVDLPLPEQPPEEPPKSELGLRYFRGESPLANELTEGETTHYHTPEPLMAQEIFWIYQIHNDDWMKWGPRNWQIGVVAEDTEGLSGGAGVLHVIQINALLVEEEYAASVS